jgi:hypothetical protein
MSRFFLTAVIALLCCLGSGVVSAQPTPTTQEAATWQKFTSPEGRFGVLMPSKPEYSKQSMPLEAKLNVDMHMFTAMELQSPNPTAYSVAYADFPFVTTTPDASSALLDAAQAGLIEKNTVLARSSLQLRGNPGREVKLKDPKGMVSRVRLFLVKERIYMVMVFSNSEKGLVGSDRFLSSFDFNVKRAE